MVVDVAVAVIGFNSTIVQLTVLEKLDETVALCRFNSTIVQLTADNTLFEGLLSSVSILL